MIPSTVAITYRYLMHAYVIMLAGGMLSLHSTFFNACEKPIMTGFYSLTMLHASNWYLNSRPMCTWSRWMKDSRRCMAQRIYVMVLYPRKYYYFIITSCSKFSFIDIDNKMNPLLLYRLILWTLLKVSWIFFHNYVFIRSFPKISLIGFCCSCIYFCTLLKVL